MDATNARLFFGILDAQFCYWVLALLVGFLLISKLFFRWLNNLHIFQCIKKLPRMQTPMMLSYYKVLSVMYKEEVIAPHNYFFLQALCGLCNMYRKHELAFAWIALRPVVFLFKPESIKIISNHNSAIDKSAEYRFLHSWLGTGLLTSSGDKWKARRKLLTPAFHFRILEDFIPVYNDQSKVLVDKMKKLVNEDWVDIMPLMTLCTLDIICDTAMGTHVSAQENSDSDYVRAISQFGKIFFYRIGQPWLWKEWMFRLFPSGKTFHKGLKIVHGFTRKVIRERKEFLLKRTKTNCGGRTNERNGCCITRRSRRVFLDLLLEHHFENPSFTEEDIREEVDTFMFEGHDTTAMALSWALYSIGLYPEVQKKIVKELDDIFDGDRERDVTSDDIKAMKYIECVLKESMRLYPSVPFVARELQEDVDVLGYTIPPGCLCLIFTYMLHRDPDIYENPEKFDPDRFLPENCAGRHPYAYIPFSAGPRNCIGQKFALLEEKSVIANIFRNFEVKSLDQRDKLLIIPDIILRSAKPLRIKLIPRWPENA